MLLNPERIGAGMEGMIATERETSKGSPEKETRMWSEKLSEAGRKRTRYQEMAAEGLVTFGELRERLAELEEKCEVVRRELDALAGCMERAERLERNLETLLEQTASVRPEDLDELTGDQRNEIYGMLRLEITLCAVCSVLPEYRLGDDKRLPHREAQQREVRSQVVSPYGQTRPLDPGERRNRHRGGGLRRRPRSGTRPAARNLPGPPLHGRGRAQQEPARPGEDHRGRDQVNASGLGGG